MKSHRKFARAIGVALAIVCVSEAKGQSSNPIVSAPVYIPDYSYSKISLPDGIFAWDALAKTVEATNGQAMAHFDFTFTNVSVSPVTILAGLASCSCTKVTLPQTPWKIPAGGTGGFPADIDLGGKSGTLFKTAIIITDHGTKNLQLRVDIAPPEPTTMTDAQRMAGVAAAKGDRQAIFKGDCASCHNSKIVPALYGPQLFAAVCAICHESLNRASMVPDLGNLKVPTNPEYWRTWITYGKAGTLMPAFAQSQGGPLTDKQIATLAEYLNSYHPPKAAAGPQ